CNRRLMQLIGRFGKQFEPAVKQRRIKWGDILVLFHGVAMISARSKHNRRPEVTHDLQMWPPLGIILANDMLEDRSQRRILTHLAIKCMHHVRNGFFGYVATLHAILLRSIQAPVLSTTSFATSAAI